jgi:hypothetical protein
MEIQPFGVTVHGLPQILVTQPDIEGVHTSQGMPKIPSLTVLSTPASIMFVFTVAWAS